MIYLTIYSYSHVKLQREWDTKTENNLKFTKYFNLAKLPSY